MTTKEASPFTSYSSLMDKHLMEYFKRTRVKNHLRKMGLITKEGQIVPEEVLRIKMAKKEHEEHVRDMLAHTIVNKTLDMERQRQLELHRRLEELSKAALVRRIKGIRSLPEDDELIAYFLPNINLRSRSEPDIYFNKKSHARTSHSAKVRSPIERPGSSLGYNDENKNMNGVDNHDVVLPVIVSSKVKHDDDMLNSVPKSTIVKRRSKAKRPSAMVQGSIMIHRAGPVVRNQSFLQSLCTVTMRFFGKPVHMKRTIYDDAEVTVEQQHCGGNTLIIFKDKVALNCNFTFTSRRHRGFPFSLTLYVNGQVDLRLSSCCEYKYRSGVRLGGKLGNFAFVQVDGAAPCYKCQGLKTSESSVRVPKNKKNTEQPQSEITTITSDIEQKEESIDKEEEIEELKQDDYEDDFEGEKENDKDIERSDSESHEESQVLALKIENVLMTEDKDDIVKIVSDEDDDDDQKSIVVEIEEQSSEEPVLKETDDTKDQTEEQSNGNKTLIGSELEKDDETENNNPINNETEENVMSNSVSLSEILSIKEINEQYQSQIDISSEISPDHVQTEPSTLAENINLISDLDEIIVDSTQNQLSDVSDITEVGNAIVENLCQNYELDAENLNSSFQAEEDHASIIGIIPPVQYNGPLTDMLKSNRSLYMEGCALSEDQINEVIKWLENQEELEALEIRNGQLSDDQLERIVLALERSSAQPTVFNFNLNNISATGVQHIVKILKMAAVQVLLLHGNPLGDEGMKILVDGLILQEESQKKLQWLDVGDCAFGNLGLERVITLLQKSSSLTHLSLTGNSQISMNGFTMLAEVLSENKTLKSLALDYCGLENPDIIFHLIAKNSCLTSLDLEGNNLTNENAESILQMVEAMPCLKELELNVGNSISKDVIKQITDILKNK